MYAGGDFDLTGFARGAVEREQLLPQQKEITNGDSVIGLISSSVNSSGFAIIRKLLRKEGLTYESSAPFAENCTIKQCLLLKNKIHFQSIVPLTKKNFIKAAAYINEGGLIGSLSRILPPSFKIILDASTWNVPQVFHWIAHKANLTEKEMTSSFNCGIDMILIVKKDHKSTVLESLRAAGEKAEFVGHVVSCEEGKEIIFLKKI